jgi:hypothetical protein
MTDDVMESLIQIIIDAGMERRDVATDIARGLMARPDSPLVRYKERAEKNAAIANDLWSITNSWCDLQIAHPGGTICRLHRFTPSPTSAHSSKSVDGRLRKFSSDVTE